VGSEVLVSPAVSSDGAIYAATSAELWKILSNGVVAWHVTTSTEPEPVRYSTAIAEDGTVYVRTDRLYAVHADGSIAWSSEPGCTTDSPSSIELAANGDIYVPVGCAPPHVASFHADGGMAWSVNLPVSKFPPRVSTVAVGKDGTAYVAVTGGNPTPGSQLVSIGAGGSIQWLSDSFDEIAPGDPCLVVDPNGVIYIPTISSTAAIDKNGHLLWTVPMSGEVAVGPNGTAYITADKVYAIDSNGGIMWSWGDPSTAYGSPVVSGIRLYVAASCPALFSSCTAGLVALSTSGNKLWELQGVVPSTLFMGAGVLYLVDVSNSSTLSIVAVQ
jgi:outer membrane protein assembly factor BamB